MSINKKDRHTLELYFKKNAIPTETQFKELIYSGINQIDDGVVKEEGKPLRIQAEGSIRSNRPVLNLHDIDNDNDNDPAWSFNLNPGVNKFYRSGFGINDAVGNNRLFIDASTGYVGIGTNNPQSQLHVTEAIAVGNYAWASLPGTVIVTGQYAGYEFVRRNLTSKPSSFEAGDRYIWLNATGTANLWTDKFGNVLSVTNDGKLGIGTANPIASLHIANTLDATLTATTAMMIGDVNSNNLALDSNEILSRNSGKPADMHLQREGGNLYIHFGADEATRFSVKSGGNVGVGTVEPTHKLHVLANNAVGLFESTGTEAYLRLYTNEGSTKRVGIANREGGRLALFIAGSGDALNILQDGNVGIGTSSPVTKLHISTTADADLTKHGALLIGDVNSNNLVLDNNEIMARKNGQPSDLNLQMEGGNLYVHYNTGDSTRFSVKSDGKVGVGTASPENELHVIGTIAAGKINSSRGMLTLYSSKTNEKFHILNVGSYLYFSVGNTPDISPSLMYIKEDGTGRFNGNWSTGSSREMKTDISDLSVQEAFSALDQLDSVKFRYKQNASGPLTPGFIAEDAPDLVAVDDHTAINYNSIIAILTKVVREQQNTITQLQVDVSRLQHQA